MLTKHPSYSFSCLTTFLCVFCRNEETEMKSKQFGQEMKKLCSEEVVITTIGFYGHDHRAKIHQTAQPTLGVFVTTKYYGQHIQCSRDHESFMVTATRHLVYNISIFDPFWPIFQCVFKANFYLFLGFKIFETEALLYGFPSPSFVPFLY